MRLLDNAVRNGLILGLSVVLAACGRGGDEPRAIASASDVPVQAAGLGPEGDYPQLLGEPFTVDGQLYTPEDVLSYDSVGYASVDASAGPGITVAHKTLPYPSYVEITSLDSGTTIMARVTDRGPMTSSRLVALSSDAAAQIGVAEGGAVRVRRMNPPEHERAKLRAGEALPTRLEMPKSLIAVLRQKLPPTGSASLRSPAAERASASGVSNALGQTANAAAVAPSATPPSAPTAIANVSVEPSRNTEPAASSDLATKFDNAFAGRRVANRSYPLPPIAGVAIAAPVRALPPVVEAPRPVVVASQQAAPLANFSLPGRVTQAAAPVAAPARVTPPARPAQSTANIVGTDTGFVIQAAAFSSKTNAERAATSIDGFVRKAGRFYRVRTGPYATRGQAEAALAKVRAAGYSDARVFTAG